MGLISRTRYLFTLVPVVTDWIDTGHMPGTPREWINEVILGSLIAFGVWLLHRERERMRALALTDGLTGIGNRRAFTVDLAREVTRARRLGASLSLAYVDVNNFKAVNDRYGHDAGDTVLMQVAARLRDNTRDGVDFAYRLGGDEFAVIFTGEASKTSWEAIERALASSVAAPELPPVACAVGLATLAPGEAASELVARADASMYARKREAAARHEPFSERSDTPYPVR